MPTSETLTLPVSERDHIEGEENAPLTLVEYGDYECPYCGMAFPVVKKLQKTLGKKLRFVFRNFPLTQMHPFALAAAQTAEAAAYFGKFWPMHDLLYKNQQFLGTEELAQWLRELTNASREELQATLKRPEIAKRLKEDRTSGIRSGVNGTPTFYINGNRFDGNPTYEALLGALQTELEPSAR